MRSLLLLTFLLSSQVFATYLFVEGRFDSNKNWLKFSQDEKLNVKNLLIQLKKSPVGAALIERAKQKAEAQGEGLFDVIKAGEGSLTDTTLVRRFTKGHPEDIQYESRSIVYINKDLSQYDAVMDLAHELTHFVFRKDFNPYTKNFTLDEFITGTIEGVGGEVQAFLMECKVHYQLFKNKSPRGNCKYVMDEMSGSLSRDMAVRKFYQVGGYYQSFKKMLKKYGIEGKFPFVDDSSASFVSSAYGIPYPVAAFEEYLTVLNKVCQNDKRRLGYLQRRTPASADNLQRDFNQRCSSFID